MIWLPTPSMLHQYMTLWRSHSNLSHLPCMLKHYHVISRQTFREVIRKSWFRITREKWRTVMSICSQAKSSNLLLSIRQLLLVVAFMITYVYFLIVRSCYKRMVDSVMNHVELEKWALPGLNQWPLSLHLNALPTELRAQLTEIATGLSFESLLLLSGLREKPITCTTKLHPTQQGVLLQERQGSQ